jgi:threonine/homoserine/homoserine lactone efflux protein
MPPIGPTNFAIMAEGFKKQIKAGVAIGTGAGFMDFVYIMAAYGGVSAIKSFIPGSIDNFFDLNEKNIKIVLTLLGCFVVIFYGIKIMKMKAINDSYEENILTGEKLEEVVTEKVETKLIKAEKELDKILHTRALEKNITGTMGHFLTGVLLCLSSVTLPASWFAIVSYFKSYGIIDSSFLSGLSLAAGVLFGTVLWFYTLVKLISKNSHKMNPKVLNKINICVGIILLLVGIFLLIKAIDFAFFT